MNAVEQLLRLLPTVFMLIGAYVGFLYIPYVGWGVGVGVATMLTKGIKAGFGMLFLSVPLAFYMGDKNSGDTLFIIGIVILLVYVIYPACKLLGNLIGGGLSSFITPDK